jgi:PAS domain S-box-containing protein
LSQDDEFKAFFEAASGAHIVLTPQLVIYAASDAYLELTMTRREDIIGRPVFEVFPDNPDEPEARGSAAMRAVYQRLLREKLPQRLPVQRYPIRRPAAAGGGFEERFWSPRNTPLLGADGEVVYIVHHVEDVTEVVRLQRQKVEQDRSLSAAAERSERFVELLDTAPDAIVIVGDDGLIELVNVQTELLFGYLRDELIGQRLELLVPERFRREHGAHLSRFFASPGARAMGSGLELYGRRKDGSEIPIEVSLSPHRREGKNTVSAAIRDISERKRLEAAARLTNDRLASAVETMQDAFALFDAQDRLILCNSVYRRLLQPALPGALVGKPFLELFDALLRDVEFPSEQARQSFRQDRIARRHREPTTVFDVHMRDGRRLRVIDRQTAEGGMVKTIWDLTDEARQAEELREARAAAEAASAAKSEFLASMSHELRTPLNAILGFAQLLQMDKRDPLSPRHRERVGHILSGGEHLLRLIDDVLDLARIEAGRVSVSVEPVAVMEVLQEALKTLDPIAQRQGVELKLDPYVGELPQVLADRTRFAQILMNLGSNAIKYNRPDGKVTFTLSTPEPSRVRVTVIDTGMGIPPEKQSKLFQPFQRAGQETGPIEGTGIGLVITRQLAMLMEGSVGFSSVPGEGSAFWVEVPSLTNTRPRPGPTLAKAVATQLSGADHHHLVLYVEDNPANVTFMRDLMGSFEHVELVTVPNAEMGVEVARARRPRAILMDINLPGMSGVDGLHQLRKLPETRDIPVIALTAAASERDKQVGIQAGFFRYLTKPVKVDELLCALEQVLTAER